MSKRFIFPQQSGERKKPKLDISVSDHNFPLSQNAGSNNVENHFDDIDDELLLQASQACEQACNASMLPPYSQFKPPSLTSTQLSSQPSSSKNTFSFKTPSAGQKNTISTNLKDKCERISSPLRGIATKVTETIDLTGNYFNDKVLNTQDNNYLYRQLLELKEENAKLKSENGILLEKCVTKEGEASILRTQLKTCQIAVDNARLEKIKVHEQAQIQWSEKLHTVNQQLHDIKTQLDSKNLEIISMKEKCKMLESNKVKLTQITVAGNDMARHNNSLNVSNILLASQARKVKTASTTVQTESNPPCLKLSRPCRIEQNKVTEILPLIMDSATEPQYSILDYNEKLKRPTDFSPNKSRILSSFYRPSSGVESINSTSKVKLNLSCIYEDLMCIAACNNDFERTEVHYINILEATMSAVEAVKRELELVARRMTSAFQKEMDRRYLDASDDCPLLDERDLITGRWLFPEEQGVRARRLTGVLGALLADTRARAFAPRLAPRLAPLLALMADVCALLDDNCCGVLYSGLVLAIAALLAALHSLDMLDTAPPGAQAERALRAAAAARAAPAVALRLLELPGLRKLCGGGNVKVDYDQGVLLYKKDTCMLQVLLRQVEGAVRGRGRGPAVCGAARGLLRLYASPPISDSCKCESLLVEVMVYALKICSDLLEDPDSPDTGRCDQQREVLSVCRSGLQALARAEPPPPADGHLLAFCERLHAAAAAHNEFHGTMLSELMSTFQAAGEEAPAPRHRLPWLRSFDSFSIAD